MFEYVCPKCSALMDLEAPPATAKDLCCGKCQHFIDPIDAARQQGRYEAGTAAKIAQLAVTQERQRVAGEQNRKVDRRELKEEKFVNDVSFAFQIGLAVTCFAIAILASRGCRSGQVEIANPPAQAAAIERPIFEMPVRIDPPKAAPIPPKIDQRPGDDFELIEKLRWMRINLKTSISLLADNPGPQVTLGLIQDIRVQKVKAAHAIAAAKKQTQTRDLADQLNELWLLLDKSDRTQILRVDGMWDIINDKKPIPAPIEKPAPEPKAAVAVPMPPMAAPVPVKVEPAKVESSADVLSKTLTELDKLEASLKKASVDHDPDKPSPNYTAARNGIDRVRRSLTKQLGTLDADVPAIKDAIKRIDKLKQ